MEKISENVIYFDKMNVVEDYENMREGFRNQLDYSVGPGNEKFSDELEVNIKILPSNTIIADVHTYPSNIIFNDDELWTDA